MAVVGCLAVGDGQMQGATLEHVSDAPKHDPSTDDTDGTGLVDVGASEPNEAMSPNAPLLPPAANPNTVEAVPKLMPQVGWSGVIGNGQSLSGGVGSSLPKPTTPSSYGYMLADSAGNWLLEDPNASTLRLAPLVEPFHPGARRQVPTGYATNAGGQTPHTTMASQIGVTAQELGVGPWVTVHAVTGISGQPMSAVGPGGTLNSYAAGLFEARATMRLAACSTERFTTWCSRGTTQWWDSAQPTPMRWCWRPHGARLRAATRCSSIMRSATMPWRST